MGGANTSFRLAKKTLAQQAGNLTANSTVKAKNVTKPADLEIAAAPYNCTGAANSTVNKYDGLVHETGGKRKFSEDGCPVGGVNDSYKHTGHPLNKTKIAENEAPEETSSNSTTSATSTNSTAPATSSNSTTSTNSSSNSTTPTEAALTQKAKKFAAEPEKKEGKKSKTLAHIKDDEKKDEKKEEKKDEKKEEKAEDKKEDGDEGKAKYPIKGIGKKV